jgi:hypothetical protein
LQKDVAPPLIFEFLTKGADSFDFELAAHSFLHSYELSPQWNNLEEDLPVLVKILRNVRYTDESHLPERSGRKELSYPLLCPGVSDVGYVG